MPECLLRDPEPRIEKRRPLPVAYEGLSQPRRACNKRAGPLHPPPQVPQPPLVLSFVLLARVIGQAARDLEVAGPPRRRRDLLRVLVRVAE